MWDRESSARLREAENWWVWCLRLLLFMLIIWLFLLLTGGVEASNYTHTYNGTTYTWHNGYWWHGNNAYTRTYYQTPAYYSYGVYYPAVDHYNYAHAYTYTPPAQAAAVPTYKPGGWIGPLLDLAKQRDAAEGQIRTQAADYANFQSAVKLLGLEGPRPWQGYGLTPAVSGYGTPYYGYGTLNQLSYSTQGVQGQTLYGHNLSYNTAINPYGDTSVAAMFSAAVNLAQTQQALNDKATTGVQQIVAQTGQNQAKLAEIQARGAATVEFLKNLQQPSSSLQTQEYRFQVGPDPNGGIKVQKVVEPPPASKQMPKAEEQAQNSTLERFKVFVVQRCASCHLGENKRGKFSLEGWGTFPTAKKLQVAAWLADTANRPKGCETGAITEADLELFRSN